MSQNPSLPTITRFPGRTELLLVLVAVTVVWGATPGRLIANQNVIVLVDDSGSMVERMPSGVQRIQAAKNALKIVLATLPEDTSAGVLALNQGWIVPLQPVNTNQLGTHIDRLTAEGQTLLGKNMKVAADELLRARAEQVYGDYRLLVVTDGEANDQGLLDFVLRDVLARGITVDVIGVDMRSDHSLATQVHNYRRADDETTLKLAIAESLAESDAQEADVVGKESDFELIAGLPDDVAASVLSALTTVDNRPVGETGVAPSDSDDGSTYAAPGPGPVGPAYPGNTIPGNGQGGGLKLGLVLCMGLVFFAVSTILAMLRAGRARR